MQHLVYIIYYIKDKSELSIKIYKDLEDVFKLIGWIFNYLILIYCLI